MIDFPALCESIRARDPEASETMVKLLRMRFRAGLERRFGDLAEDLLQELCAAVLKSIQEDRIEHPDNPFAYAHEVVEHLRIRAAEQASRALKIVSIEDYSPAVPATQEEEAIKRNILGFLLRTLRQLPELDQEIVRRACFEDQSSREISEALGHSEPIIRSRKSRAIGFLRAEYRRLSQPKEMLAA